MVDFLIPDVTAEHRPDGAVLYRFRLTGGDYKCLGVIKRFGEDEGGVQRPLKDAQVLRIAEAMTDRDHEWLEPVLGELCGDWCFDEDESTLTAPNWDRDKQYLSVDDGQHRLAALKTDLLTPEEVEDLVFDVKAYVGFGYDKRLKIFRMQAGRARIDKTLDLAQRHELNAWRSEVDSEAYKIVLALAEDEGSPLYGRIQLKAGETERFAASKNKTMRKIGASGLFGAIKPLLKRRCRLSTLRTEVRQMVIIETIRAASEIWSVHWDNPSSTLTTAAGIKTILMLFVSGANFREEIGGSYTMDNIRAALEHAHSFTWYKSRTKNRTPRDLADSLDQAVNRGAQTARRKRANGQDRSED